MDDLKSEIKSDTVSGALEQMEAEGIIPKLDRTDTLEGIDSDDNGIRDDIDDYIKSLDLPAKGVDVTTSVARGYQRVQEAGEMTTEVAVEIVDSYSADLFCSLAGSKLDGQNIDQVTQNIQAYTSNTLTRSNRYIEYNVALNGSNIDVPSFNECLEMGY